jgi:hypothetical protein
MQITTQTSVDDFCCYEEVCEILQDVEEKKEDLNMKSHLHEMSVLTGNKLEEVIWGNIRSRFLYWGTDKSPFTHSKSQLY